MAGLLSRLFSSKKEAEPTQDLDDLQLYLMHCDDQFFESSFVHSLKPEHRKTLLIALRLFYPGKDYNPRCKRNRVWQFFAERYPFTDKEMQDHCDVTPLENLFDVFTDLPLQSKIAIVLIVNCILNIDKNATEKQRLIAKSIYTILDISPEYYRAIMNEFKGANHHKGINYIYELA